MRINRAGLFSSILVFTSVALASVLVNWIADIMYQRLQRGGKIFVEAALKENKDAVQIDGGVHKSHPYILYQNTPRFFAHGFQQINSQGYRGREIPEPKIARV